ncbi:hypothetical protein ACF3MZ_11200 [Paenibacillaceae bacterium WGS1546]|uniref:hypothetical protein n=1 Tax=Cohnella sp. WGS1546 TaxID=3366810 RepID=UPI00372CE863
MTNETLVNILYVIVGVGTVLSLTLLVLNNKLAEIHGSNKYKFSPKIKKQYK